MTVHLASLELLPQVRYLLHCGRHVHLSLGMEDLAPLFSQGVVMVGRDGARLWGVLCVQLETRPSTLPPAAPDRAYLRGVGLAAGRSPGRDVPTLAHAALEHLRRSSAPQQVIALSNETWLVQPLLAAGFQQVDQVRSFVRTRRDVPVVGQPARLRPATQADLVPLARLDAETFVPLWHMGEAELIQLLFTCRLQVALWREQVAGYAAIAVSGDPDSRSLQAQLVRLAVHPTAQGRGIGRQLVTDSIAYALSCGASRVHLNTQASNRRSQQLYTALGFRAGGRPISVLVQTVHGHLTETLAPGSPTPDQGR